MEEDPRFLSEQLITYIGNKRGLLSLIGKGIHTVQQRLGTRKLKAFDAFSGSGVVSRYLKKFCTELYCNDLETYSRILNECYLTNFNAPEVAELAEIHQCLTERIEGNLVPGLIAENYAPADDQHILPGERVFYTRQNAIYLDTARKAISQLAPELQSFFLAPLLSLASVHTNTSGVFKGFHKNSEGIGQFGGRAKNALQRIMAPMSLPLPLFSRFTCESHVMQQDATAAARTLPPIDVAYLDPPYNQHPYGSNYFMLNLIVEYSKPQNSSRISGIPTNWNRSAYNSRKQAADTLQELICNIPAPFILISYNSEGFIDRARMEEILRPLGKFELMEQEYATFRGCRNLQNRPKKVAELLYLLERK